MSLSFSPCPQNVAKLSESIYAHGLRRDPQSCKEGDRLPWCKRKTHGEGLLGRACTLISPGPNDAPIEPSPGTPLAYQDRGDTKRTPTQETPPRSTKRKLRNHLRLSCSLGAVPPPPLSRSPRPPSRIPSNLAGSPLPAGPSHRPRAAAGVAG